MALQLTDEAAYGILNKAILPAWVLLALFPKAKWVLARAAIAAPTHHCLNCLPLNQPHGVPVTPSLLHSLNQPVCCLGGPAGSPTRW